MIIWNNDKTKSIRDIRTFYDDGLTIKARFIASSNEDDEDELNYKISPMTSTETLHTKQLTKMGCHVEFKNGNQTSKT